MVNCRICKNGELYRFLDLGTVTLANSFLKKEELSSEEPAFPLELCLCEKCGLVQLKYVVPPELMFKNYIYVSGTSDTIPVHFAELAKSAIERFEPNSNSLVVDIGSNDGTLLKGFRSFGVRVLGVDPAENVAKIAEAKGIETIVNFFNEEVARKILKEKGKAKIITATNVFGHTDDLDESIRSVKIMLEDEGVFIIEVPYLVNMLENVEFDTIYHEHLSYFAVRPLVALFKRFDMEVFDVKRLAVHGGSIRIFVKRIGSRWPVSNSVDKLLQLEKGKKLDAREPYKEFAQKVVKLREDLVSLLKKLRVEGKRVVGYGAPAKGNTLLNYCKIDNTLLEYTIDKSPLKQWLYTPGMHIPVYPVEKILHDIPDYLLILAWNFAEEIMAQQQKYKERGGKFIIPIPELRIVE